MLSLPHDASGHYRHMIPLILKPWLTSDREVCLPKYVLLMVQALPFFGEIVGEIFSLDAEQRGAVITFISTDEMQTLSQRGYPCTRCVTP